MFALWAVLVGCSPADQLLGSTFTDGDPVSGCDTDHPCAGSGTVCALGECRKSFGSCSSDADCQGDTFCCGPGCTADPAASPVCVELAGANPQCRGAISAGVFSPSVQCAWREPPAGDPFPEHKRVLTTPLVANLPNDSGTGAEILIVASAAKDGANRDQDVTGAVLRILNGQTCEQVEVIEQSWGVRDPATPAIADLDRDGAMEIVARRDDEMLAAYRWDTVQRKFVEWWRAPLAAAADIEDWDGVSVHDIDDDGWPEVIARHGAVFDGRSGARLNPGQTGVELPSDPVLGDLDVDGRVELVANKVFGWNGAVWVEKYPGVDGPHRFFAFADFGTPRSTAADFDAKTLDGVAEVVATGAGAVVIATLSGQQVMNLSGFDRGGPPTIGDFDGDGYPEVGVAGASAYRVFDLECKGAPAGCSEELVRWAQPAQDFTSAQTGSSIFDFEADGKAEVVYADECFARIYAGATGDVMYSAYRMSCTWWENPTIADVDNDSRSEIIINSNSNCGLGCPDGVVGPGLDPIHPGLRCRSNSDCVSALCDAGFCRCSSHADCAGVLTDQPGGLRCAAPLDGTPGVGNTCRMEHPNPEDPLERERLSGVQVLRDQLDRWAGSRPMWNQHAYHITHIDDDGSVPKSSAWPQNFRQPGLNNFRQNVQGALDAGAVTFLPDITGKLDTDTLCKVAGATATLTARVCNHGFRLVGADMPATFYLGAVDPEHILCVSYTQGPVPVGDGCLPVSCEVEASVPAGSTITMVVNDDGRGNATTTECNFDNNRVSIVIENCEVVR